MFSKNDFAIALASTGLFNVSSALSGLLDTQVICSKQLKNGVYFVQYKIDGKTCQTFIGYKALIRAKMQKTVEASKTVQFTWASLEKAITNKGHVCSLTGCNCEAQRFTPGSLPTIAGLSVCKHMVSYARAYHGVMSVKEFRQVLEAIV
jgi:hypothetical protein